MAAAAWIVAAAGQSAPILVEKEFPRSVNSTNVAELGKKLSSSAKIYYPGSEQFEEASARWSVLDEPQVNVVVVPGTENDVVETVRRPLLFLCPRRARVSSRGVLIVVY